MRGDPSAPSACPPTPRSLHAGSICQLAPVQPWKHYPCGSTRKDWGRLEGTPIIADFKSLIVSLQKCIFHSSPTPGAGDLTAVRGRGPDISGWIAEVPFPTLRQRAPAWASGKAFQKLKKKKNFYKKKQTTYTLPGHLPFRIRSY